MATTLHIVDETSSTNDLARAGADAGVAHGTTYLARRQTAGRGRLGRSWTTLPGALAASVVLRPSWPPDKVPQMTLAAGVALAEALAREADVRIRLAWPNDLLLDGRKLGGILCEAMSRADSSLVVIVGVGVNLTGSEDDFTGEVRSRATTLEAHHKNTPHAPLPSAEVLARRFVTHMLELVDAPVPMSELLSELRRRWRAWAALPAAVRLPDGVLGEATDIDDLGRLCVRTDGGPRVLDAGEVMWL